VDDLHEECSKGQSGSGHEDNVEVGMEDHIGNSNTMDGGLDLNFDLQQMEESLQELYLGARSIQLAATVLVMNLCTVHGMSNSCADELFAILHAHLLPELNTIPKNYHATKSLTRQLGLSYNSIHACDKCCILY
jgi:hypothetical protein